MKKISNNDYIIDIYSQASIYNPYGSVKNRKLKAYFSIPEEGTNEDTGICLFIAGFGGNSNSNIYKKMRRQFADEYNLITVQCDYFGYEFMQDTREVSNPNIAREVVSNIFSESEVNSIYENGNFDMNRFMEVAKRYPLTLQLNEVLNEDLDNFNDMGLIQAIDNISAVLNVINILYDNEMQFNSKKIIIYGHSHGAYLGYLCNAFAPNLFSVLIDNSAWLIPAYIEENSVRSLQSKMDNLNVIINFDYIAKKIIKDKKILDLSYIYSKFSNRCNIISYHGTTDNLINNNDKEAFCNNIKNCNYNEVSDENIDGCIFKSTNHGLGADFLELFKYTIDNLEFQFGKSYEIELSNNIKFYTDKFKYDINYDNVMPRIYLEKINE